MNKVIGASSPGGTIVPLTISLRRGNGVNKTPGPSLEAVVAASMAAKNGNVAGTEHREI